MLDSMLAMSSANSGGIPDVQETYYGTGSSYTYTFLNNMDYVYFSFCRNDGANWGTYTGNGKVTQVANATYNCMVKIENVKSGDTFVTPAFSISGSYRYIISVVGKKSIGQ